MQHRWMQNQNILWAQVQDSQILQLCSPFSDDIPKKEGNEIVTSIQWGIWVFWYNYKLQISTKSVMFRLNDNDHKYVQILVTRAMIQHFTAKKL